MAALCKTRASEFTVLFSMPRLPQGCEDWGARLVQHASTQYAVASQENRQNQNHWKKALQLLQEVNRPIYLNKKNQGDPEGLPPNLNPKVRDNLIQVMRRQAPCLSLGDAANVREPVPLQETTFYRNRNYKDSAYFLMASMYELTRVQDTKLTRQMILRPEARRHLRDDISLDFDHRTGKQGAWKAMVSLVNEGFVSQERGFGVNHLHWLTKLGYRMCYLLFHVKDFGEGQRPRPSGCYITKDGDVLPGSPSANFDHAAAAVSSTPIRRTNTLSATPPRCAPSTSSSGLPNLPLAHVPKSNLLLYELHQQKTAHSAPPSAFAPSFAADVIQMSDDDDADLQLALRLSKESETSHSQLLPNLHPSNAFLQKHLSNRHTANKVTLLLPGVQLDSAEQVPLKQNLFNFSSSVKGLTGDYKILGQWDAVTCKPAKMSCTCPDDKKCCKHILATLYAYAQLNQTQSATKTGIIQSVPLPPAPSPPLRYTHTRVQPASQNRSQPILSAPSSQPPLSTPSCVIVVDSDDDDAAQLPLQPLSVFTESDSLEYLGTAEASSWDAASSNAVDLLHEDEAVCFPVQPAAGAAVKKRVPRDAAISMLMCQTERHQQANYRGFYHEISELFATIMRNCSVHVIGRLPLGDFQFHFQCNGDSPDDPSLISDVIIERKTISDIVSSSAGDHAEGGTARHIRQESRLRHCNLQRPCMLFEGDADCICRILPGPRTHHDMQLSNPDCLSTGDDVMRYQASIIARNYAGKHVFVLQSSSSSCTQLFLAAVGQMILQTCREESCEAISSAKFAKFCGVQCRAAGKLREKLGHAGVHCELTSRILRRYPDEESLLCLYEACGRPLERVNVLQRLQVAGSNPDCSELHAMPGSQFTTKEAARSSSIVYQTVFGSSIVPSQLHPQACSAPDVHVFGNADIVKALVGMSSPLDSFILVHQESDLFDSKRAGVLRFFSQSCCSRSQSIHVAVARGVDVLQLILENLQTCWHGQKDEKTLCAEVAVRVAREIIVPLAASRRREQQAITSLLVLEDVVNGNGGACVRFKKRVAHSQASSAGACELENGAVFPLDVASFAERNSAALFVLMEAHLLVKCGFQVRRSKNAAETQKFVYYLLIEQRVHAPLLYEAMPIAASICNPPRAATAAATTPRPHNAASKPETIVLDDSSPEQAAPAHDFTRSPPPKGRKVAARADKAVQRQKKRQPQQPERDLFALDDSPEESAPKRRAAGDCFPVTARDDCEADSAVDGAAMRALELVLERANVVPGASRQLFAASMIRCGVSSLEALRESLAADPAELNLIKDIGMNSIQKKCLERWLENRPQ